MDTSKRFTGWGDYPAHRLTGLNHTPYTGPERVYPGSCKEPAEDGGGACGGDLTATLSKFGHEGVETSCGTCHTGDRHDHGLTTEDLSQKS